MIQRKCSSTIETFRELTCSGTRDLDFTQAIQGSNPDSTMRYITFLEKVLFVVFVVVVVVVVVAAAAAAAAAVVVVVVVVVV